ncbi:class I SAM-dependent methyltransferase [Ornithobacterium rhinotracheale]|uniref:methyltransferase domain-containing protein n=1 Tax=Ornithobacterium rhinotracheale TaxID=28251 RepID=UPI00129C98AB|nr:methyltransferase domain-containing protein [Ornithobacterium rhinotracheale]MRJ07290.1 class I SAM-dependent methyltransferase [Ornithobacterium rhinotracheale]UOH77892.1 class I SAM-dependent methyltransferase [Ornithobacterium rhinotracheale]
MDKIDDKKILDVCCGGRMFWFDKYNPDVLFSDIRKEEHTLCDGRYFEVKPDIIADFIDLPFKDEKFKLVVFDPPHLKQLGKNSWMAKKYGVLNSSWEEDIHKGFKECFRVLENNGILIFKWNEIQIKVSQIIELAGQQPLFGHKTGKHGNTIWLCFMKQ